MCELKAGDEILAIDGADVVNEYIQSVQYTVDRAVSTGQLELRIRRHVKKGKCNQFTANLSQVLVKHGCIYTERGLCCRRLCVYSYVNKLSV